LSELLGLRWQDVDLTDACAATIEITGRVDRKGKRQPLKTDSAERTIEPPGQLAVILLEHRVGAKHKQPGAFVFCSLSGRCLGQRNVTRALRLAQAKARDPRTGEPVFPELQNGAKVAPNTVPSFHGFRHSAASEAMAAGESIEEISWELGHKRSVITASIYLQEVKSRAQRTPPQRHGGTLRGAARSVRRAPDAAAVGEVVDIGEAAG
jgi:integrase